MTDALGLAEKVNKFNQQALKHLESQTLNPFSGRFSRSPSPRPRFGKDEYGKPKAGSLTDLRGQKAFNHISREILDLCNLIHDVGSRKRERGEYECDEEEDDGQIIMTFGELFAIYSKISDKVVGLLIAAKKRGFVYFEPEILFQRRDDDVLIALMKPIEEIRSIIDRQLSASPSPAGTTTPSYNDKGEQQDSSTSSEQPDEAQASQSCTDPTVNENKTQPTTELSTVKEEQVPSCNTAVTDDTPSNKSVETTPLSPETDPTTRKESECLPLTDETPSSSVSLEITAENKESTSQPNSESISDKSGELTPSLFISEPSNGPEEGIPLFTNVGEPSSKKNESQSPPITEISSNKDESRSPQITEICSNKDESRSPTISEISSNMDESRSPQITEFSSNMDESRSPPIIEISSNKDESRSLPITEISSNKDISWSPPIIEISSNKDESRSPSITEFSNNMGESWNLPVTESSSNKDEFRSPPFTESLTSNEEQTLSIQEPFSDKGEQTLS